jgi:hypothetical protein
VSTYHKHLQTVICIALVAGTLSVAPAQSNRGSMAGSITDSSGALIPGAKISIRNTQTGVSSETVSSADGNYRFPELPVGAYDVNVTLNGFKTAQRTGVIVEVNSTSALDIQLVPGNLSETVSVVSDAPTLQTESSDVGTTVNSRQVLELPLLVNGVSGLRTPEAFVFLTPGTVGPGSATDNGQNRDNPTANNGGAFQSKITGSQNFSNEVLLDGASVFRSENGSSFDETAMSVESVQEFRVLTSTYPAEFGRTGGGVTSFVIKSGTNDLHGDFYDFFRNRWLDANRFFNNAIGAPRPLDNHHDFGATIGGPIWIPKLYQGKNKTFFFFSYEGFRRKEGGAQISTLPTNAFLQGNFSSLLTTNQIGVDALGRAIFQGQIFNPATTRVVNGQTVRDPFPGNIIQPNLFSNVAKNVIKLLPQPSNSSQFQNFIFGGVNPVTVDTYQFKVDHAFSDIDRLSGSFSYRLNSRLTGLPSLPDPLEAGVSHQDFTTYYYRVNHDHTFSPTLLNHITLGFNRTRSDNRSNAAGVDWASQLGLAGVGPNLFPHFDFGEGITGIGNTTFNLNIDNGFRFSDSINWVKGKHSIKLGVDFRYQEYTPTNQGGTSGVFGFGRGQTAATPTLTSQTGFGFASFLLGDVANASNNISPNIAQWRSKYYALFVQDDVKLTRNLTLNLGLRWDVDYPRHELHNRFSSFDPTIPNPGAGGLLGAVAFAGDGPGRAGTTTFARTYHKDFGPRIGFAYSPNFGDSGFLGRMFGSNRTVIRGGYGIYYEALVYADFGERLVAGFGGSRDFPSTNGFDPAFLLDQGLPQNFPHPPFIDPTIRNGTDVEYLPKSSGRPPMIQNWSFEVQNRLATDLILSTAYVASAGHHLRSDLQRVDTLAPQYLALGDLLFADINSPQAAAAGIRPPYAGFQGQVFQALRPYPQYTFINTDCCLENIGNSTYNALQVKLERRFHSGLTLLASYTFSKAITDADSALPVFATFSGGGGVQNPYNRHAEKSISNQDIPHIAIISYIYELPVGQGKALAPSNKALNAVAGGWEVAGVLRYQSGQPFAFNGFGGPPTFGTIRPNRVPGQPLLSSAVTSGHFDPFANLYFNPAAFADPNAGRSPTDPFRFGDFPRVTGEARSPAFLNEDLSLLKNTRLFAERVNVQFRAEAFNIFNRVVFMRANTCVPCGEFGRVFGQANNPRVLQLGLKVIY